MTIFTKVQGHGKDVVLLHGGCDNHYYMQPIMDELCKHYRVTSLDELGSGKTSWQPHIETIDDLADALLPVLPEDAIYIGWSFGGLIAISLAARYPQRVTRIINIGSVPKFIEIIDWPGFAQPGFQVMLPMIAEQGLSSFLKKFHDAEFGELSTSTSYHQLNALLEKMEVDLEAINKRIHICDATDLRKEFSALRCPIDLIFGEKDEAVPTALHEKVKQLNPSVHVHLIPGAQHMMHWTHPEAFNKILMNILK